MNSNLSKNIIHKSSFTSSDIPEPVIKDFILDCLTKREWDVFLLIADDLSNEVIAEKLCLTVKSVKTYKTRIGFKISLTGREHLSRFARKNREWLHRAYLKINFSNKN